MKFLFRSLGGLKAEGPRMPPSPAPFGNASGPASCRRLTGKGHSVNGLRVQGIDFVGAAQIVESPQAALLLAEDSAQVLEGHGITAAWARQWCTPWPAAGRPPAGSRAPGPRRRASAVVRFSGSGAAALAPYRAGRGPRSSGPWL